MKDQIAFLIHKQLTGDITPTELEVLDQLLDEGGRSAAQDISTIWEVSADYQPQVSFDSDSAFANMMTRISDAQSVASDVSTVEPVEPVEEVDEAKVISIFSIKKVARWAAIMVFGVASYVVLQNTLPQTIEGGADGAFATLDDGSSVWLSPNSELKVSSSLFPARRVSLDGKGFFDITRDEEHPFKVSTDDVEIEVLGTSFAVDTQSDVVSVASGSVLVTNGESNENLIIQKGDKVSLVDGALQKSVVDKKDFNWMNPTLSFDNAPLDQVLKELALHFDVDIQYKGRRSLAECPFTATNLSDTSLEDVLAILRATYSMDIDTTTAAPSIILSKVRCR